MKFRQYTKKEENKLSAKKENRKFWLSLTARIDSSAGVASAVMQIPTVVDFPLDADPCKVIKTGDYVRLDGEKGTLEILERA